MPKIPTFTAKGSIEQLAGTTSNIQMGLNNTLASALAPVTKAVVDFKIKENDVQNRTEALKLKNDYLSETSDIEDQINQDKILSVNKEAANKFLKEKNNALIEKYSALATTQTAKTMFTNSALSDVSKQIFSIDSQISRNILVEADRMFVDSKEKLFSKAYLKGGIYKQTLQTDTEKLIIDSYKSRISAPELQKMLASVPSEIQMFDGFEMVQTTPRAAFDFLKDENNLPDISYEQRTKLQERAMTIIRPQLNTEWKNYTETIRLGKEPIAFDFEMAKDVLGVKVYEQMIQEDTFTKDRVANNSVILNASNDTVNEVVKGIIDEGNELYADSLQAAEQENYYKTVLAKRNKDMKEDIVKYINVADTDIASLYEEMNNDDNEASKLETRKLITEKLIEKQKKLNVDPSLIRITTNSEIDGIISVLTNVDTPALEKEKFIDGLSVIYGIDNMGKVLNHLQAQKLPVEYIVAMSSNSKKLKADILNGETTENIAKFVKDRLPDGKKFNTIEKGVAKGMEDFETVILNQGEGSKTKTDYLLSIQQAVYKSALTRVRDGESIDAAVDGAVNDFNKDYKIAPSQTFFVPADIGGKFVNQNIVIEKAEALIELVEGNTDYIGRFHGEDGYMHYAALAGIENLTEEQVKERIDFTIKNHSKWLMNADGTGIILNAEFTNGTYPIVNANGDKIEFFFTDTPNDKGIYSIELKAPVTGEDIEMIPYTSDVGAYEFQEMAYNNTSENKNLMTTAIDGISTVIDTAGDFIDTGVQASEMPINTEAKQVGFLGDLFFGKDRFLIGNWNKNYQTQNKSINGLKAKERLKRMNEPGYKIPNEALSAIENAATNFDGDGGFSKEYLIDALTKIGQIESQYKTKVQKTNKPVKEDKKFLARSYWQIEVTTAKDLLKNSSPVFGENFESSFSKYAKNGKTARKSLLNLSDKELVNLLEKDDTLAANIAASLIVTRFNTEKA